MQPTQSEHWRLCWTRQDQEQQQEEMRDRASNGSRRKAVDVLAKENPSAAMARRAQATCNCKTANGQLFTQNVAVEACEKVHTSVHSGSFGSFGSATASAAAAATTAAVTATLAVRILSVLCDGLILSGACQMWGREHRARHLSGCPLLQRERHVDKAHE